MLRLRKIFFTGMLVSFLGSLPLGTLNIAAMQISISEGVTSAVLFSVGSLLSEIIYVRLSLVAMDWIRKQERIFRILEWVTLAIVLALAASSFYSALHPGQTENVILSSTALPHIVLGFMMSAVNPVQIPFWFGWSTVLFTKKILLPRSDHYNAYIIGIGIGTFIGNCVFIFGGLLIASTISNNQNVLNWVIGGIFTITALIQIWKMSRKKDAVHQLEHPEEMTHGLEDKVIEMSHPETKKNP
jgi:threonine/homoserine/homoserine lactone efflux protein